MQRWGTWDARMMYPILSDVSALSGWVPTCDLSPCYSSGDLSGLKGDVGTLPTCEPRIWPHVGSQF